MSARLLAKTRDDDRLLSVRSLYDRYGAMLLGYLFEIVQDKDVAEQYLVEVFNDAAKTPAGYSQGGLNTLSQLQQLARKKLAPYYQTVKDCAVEPANAGSATTQNNKYLSQMTPQQQHVFCGLHYHGKSITVLAIELQKAEDDIRKILKESFTLIRKANGHTGLY
ncbi:hypothetical protein HDF24_22670 [Mucilaginibacter sp. X4EP1]|uniref:hypothetical protein n=1 Tax=Mucilaginibacter sp. X4EP1 TaxID=2723092 RepID=UPI00216A16C4|nr:hypothetical protein [Mucilaginibacter sp. X4EP1]MCS3816474.1 DNA-directed RNA polymerase specialized sigma24 family protein [Mucilaginibacter sp. X4EP1]